ncbi:hypothetical protein VM94_02470 [Janthinobacterium sp. KBS0711]|nr:hypothetical protein VM94_02470 [Janthinobacterium sp. KBS0711]PKV43380.1 hypothetical protein CLU92_0692 [Janthinobacterium sp. 61]TDY36308.1 hypothetical protein C8C89_4190 [Janthinobacterium sp. 75]
MVVHKEVTGRRRIPAPPPGHRETTMLTLKVLACLALSALMLAPLVLRDTMQLSAGQQLQVPNVDAQALWAHWPKH